MPKVTLVEIWLNFEQMLIISEEATKLISYSF